jgi:hypothetical protein
MPFSLDPQPKENEIECARCGAIFYYELTRCPVCGVNIYDPEDGLEETIEDSHSHQPGIIDKAKQFIRHLTGKPYSAQEVFGDSLDQAILYNDLLSKVGGDHQVVERLIEFEQKQAPDSNRIAWIENAIERWERDNRTQEMP